MPWWILHVAIVGVFTYGLHELVTRETSGHALLTMAFAVFGVIYFNFVIGRLVVNASRRGSTAPDGPYTWTFTDEGVSCVSPDVDSELKWTEFSRVRETTEFFLLYMARRRALFVPKRALVGSQSSEIRQLLSRARLIIATRP